MEEEFFNKLREKVLPYFEGTNPCHDICHADRVLSLVLAIGGKEGADLEILKVVALLHDVARKEQDESRGKICHAERGSELAWGILRELGYPEDKIEKVIHCIEAHRSRKGDVPESIEAKVLYDADKLDSIGAIGIGRAFSFSGSIGSVVHISDVDVNDNGEYGREDCAYREFLAKLVQVKYKMFTDEGKKIAGKRYDFMVEFFDRLNREIKGEL
ncbi:HD domain-containing protein [Candidatus Pacearchaeota archaeon]|nr:HD domain-containing protein [Candidatus Pacearchaeota archaeon]